MPGRNVDLVRTSFEAFGRGDFDVEQALEAVGPSQRETAPPGERGRF